MGAECQLPATSASQPRGSSGASLADQRDGCYEAEPWGQVPYPETKKFGTLPVHSNFLRNVKETKQENFPPQRPNRRPHYFRHRGTIPRSATRHLHRACQVRSGTGFGARGQRGYRGRTTLTAASDYVLLVFPCPQNSFGASDIRTWCW